MKPAIQALFPQSKLSGIMNIHLGSRHNKKNLAIHATQSHLLTLSPTTTTLNWQMQERPRADSDTQARNLPTQLL